MILNDDSFTSAPQLKRGPLGRQPTDARGVRGLDIISAHGYVDIAWFVVGVPSLAGASFAAVASLLRRRYGSRALLAVTVVGLVLAVTVVTRLDVIAALFFPVPEIPGLLVAAGVLEWRARRASDVHLWRHVVWGTAAFVLAAVVALMVVAASVRSTGWVGWAA